MNTRREEIALVPDLIQNQDDDEVLNKKSLQNFNSKKHLKEFILWILVFVCFLLVAGPLALHITYSVPTVKTRNVLHHIFSEERALDYLINLTQFGSRVSNTRGNFDARDYLILQINRISSMNKRNLQYEIDLQNFTTSNHNQLQNILVRVSNPIRKSKDIPSLMLSAHYDTVEFSPGGSDDGSGVVILLELLSNLVNDLTITFSDIHLIVLFTNAEESGLEGAKAFITNHSWRFNIHRFLSVDSVSCNEIGSLFQTTSSQLVIDYSRVLRPRANIILKKIAKWFALRSDYDTLNLNDSRLGYDFGFLLDGYIYHTTLDHPSMIKKGVIQDLGENLGVLTRNILLGNVQQIDNVIDTEPLIYFDILGRYLMVYQLSTSILIQQILVGFIIFIGLILMILDHIWHRQRALACNGFHCIYFRFKYPFILRIITIIIYSISHIISVIIGLLFSLLFAATMSIVRPVLWHGNSTLALFLFSFPCLIGSIISGYLFDRFHRFILRKSPKNSSEFNPKRLNQLNFDFEQNFSVLLVCVLLMILAIYFNNQLFYIILVWSIFICPMYLLLMIIQFIVHWKEKHWNFFEEGYHWLYLPLIISLLPLTHTIEIINRIIRILIPIFVRLFSYSGWGFRLHLIMSCIIAIPTIFFVLIFLPILQRTKQFGRTLIVLLIIFVIVVTVALIRQPFTENHPNTYYAKHMSKLTFKVEKLTNVPFSVPLISQTSSIRVITYHGLVLSPVLDQFSSKSGHILHNKNCITSTNCTFDDTFNRKLAVEDIKIQSMKNSLHYTIVVQHILAYNIRVSSLSDILLIVHNELNIPRKETIIDVILSSTLFTYQIDIKIRRCEISDSPFLLLFTHLLPNMVIMGEGSCHAIEDDAILIFDLNLLSK